MKMFDRVAKIMEFFGRKRYDIGRAGDPYLTRWVLLGERFSPGRKLFLHYFWRSDYAGALHDHPWKFWSFVVWPGYIEVSEALDHPYKKRISDDRCDHVIDEPHSRLGYRFCDASPEAHLKRRQIHAFSLIFRPAIWRHRVQKHDENGPCWTIVLTGTKDRSWGFWCPTGFLPWKEHVDKEMSGIDGCA